MVMRFLVVYAHPVEDSFQSAIHARVLDALVKAGHQVDDCNLYAEGFQPVLSQEERYEYHNACTNRSSVQKDVERLLNCNGLFLIFPTWWYGMPAILKGYFDRVWLPGVAFDVVGARTRPLLSNIVRFAVVTTYGSPWWLNKLVGDPNRKVLLRGVRRLLAREASTLWLAQYGLDLADQTARHRFLNKVECKIRSF
jgi:NAD(P)H dehydrogenase (quinone)